MPTDTTTAVRHPSKAHLGLPTISWLRPSGFDKHSCPYAGQWSNSTNHGHFHHGPKFITFTGREQRLFGSRVITNFIASSSKPRTTCHTSNCGCNLPKPRPHMDCVVQYDCFPENGIVNSGHALSTHSLGDQPPAVAASGAISARRGNSKSEKPRNSTFL